MPQRRFGTDDVLAARFAVSPMWELVASLRVLGSRKAGPHARWTARTTATLDEHGVDLAVLLALVPPTGHLADFLTPTPTSRLGDFDTELDLLSRSTDAEISRDLGLLAPGLDFNTDLEALRHTVIDDLRTYWNLTLKPIWPRLQGLAEADIAWRLEQIAASGATAAFDGLHPRVRLVDGELLVSATCLPAAAAPATQGLILVPSAFAWPEILVLDRPEQTTTVTYACRGVGDLWNTTPEPDPAVTHLLGSSRAKLLRALDLPATTSQLAERFALSAASTNTHLQILLGARLVSRRRQGRFVYYDRTALGTDLLGR